MSDNQKGVSQTTTPLSGVCWNDIWVAKQELGAALEPVFACLGAPPEWASRLGDLLDEIDPILTELAQKEDQW